MDLVKKDSMEITALALEGLAARHRAISANIANANTPDYQPTDVQFEGQLQQIIQTNEAKNNHVEIKKPLTYADFKPQIVNGAENNAEMAMSELAKNGMKYNALAELQSKNYKWMEEIIKTGGR